LALARTGVERSDLGPGGRDVTRLAGGSPDVWTAIARDNADALDAALATAERELAEIRGALRRADATELRQRLTSARAWFDV
jgi:prephenate dehydrogenase